ncbi:hypothetical protein [Pseudacidovorax intermedius]|uniref:Uncharacterized protein n=1 Tax=Pseudacidovorax intermedius TaxID=433924 RepID=A0A147GM84_9BURK|nr:hypothetical protein [Pseudacidovorax intermedius]KTT14741.1 hypothetical protein NS331_22590 [Pseudacidovorax intermedius]
MAPVQMASADTGSAQRGAIRAVIQIRQRGYRRQAFSRLMAGTSPQSNWSALPVPAAEKALRRGVLELSANRSVPAVSEEVAKADEQVTRMERREFDNIDRGMSGERCMPELPHCIPESWCTAGIYWLAYPRSPLAAELYDVINPGAATRGGYLATVDDFGFLVKVPAPIATGAAS